MQIGWIDFSKEDRKKVLSVIDLLSEDGTLDELGIAAIRDGFADIFFPGTSTIQTRAKYFLLVPYALDSIIHASNVSVKSITEKLDQEERECAKILNELEVDGVVGSRALKTGGWVQRTPADIYWAGIRRYEIFQGGNISLTEYLRTAVALKESKKDLQKLGNRNDDAQEMGSDDGDAGSLYSKSFWKLPDYDRKTWKDDLSMDLSQEEAEFLKERIITTQPNSLLAFILQMELKEVLLINSFHDLEVLVSKFPSELQEIYYHARAFSDFIYLARIRYNLILSEGKNQRAVKQWSIYEPKLAQYADLDLEEIFRRLDTRNVGLKRFLNALQDSFILSDINEADQLIIRRETNLKGVNRAKLNFPGKYPVDNWLSGELLNYRFSNAMVLVRDIFNGLEGL